MNDMKIDGYEFGMWRTGVGVDMRIVDMDDGHLLNTIAMLKRALNSDVKFECMGLKFHFPASILMRRRRDKLAELEAEHSSRNDRDKLKYENMNLRRNFEIAEDVRDKAIEQAHEARNDAMALASKVRAFQQASMIEHDDVTPEMLRQWVQDLGDDYAKLERTTRNAYGDLNKLYIGAVTACDQANAQARGWQRDYENEREQSVKYELLLKQICDEMFLPPGSRSTSIVEEVKKAANDRKRLSKLYADLRARVEDFYQLAVRNEKMKQA